MNNFLSWCRCALILSCSMLIAACEEPPPTRASTQLVKALELGDSEGIAERSFPGRAEAALEADLSFRVGGQVQQLLVDVGDAVSEGDILAILDQTDFNNALNITESTLAEAEAAYTNARANHTRSLNVQRDDAGAISELAIDRTQAALSIATAAVDAATAARDITADRLGYTELRAPFSGEVAANYIEAFESVLIKQPVVRLLNRSNIEFDIDIPESLIGYANDITEVSVVFDAQRDVEIMATVQEVGRQASRSTRTFPMTLLLQQTDAFDILPGMAGTASVRARLADSDSHLSIPAAALFQHPQGGSAVWTIVDERLVLQQVEVGLPNDFGIEVSAGLSPGDWLVTAGVHSLTEGQVVAVIQ